MTVTVNVNVNATVSIKQRIWQLTSEQIVASSGWYVPSMQGSHAVAPSSETVPAAHCMHTMKLSEPPTIKSYAHNAASMSTDLWARFVLCGGIYINWTIPVLASSAFSADVRQAC